MSSASAIGSPWKLPPLMTRPPPVAMVAASATPPPGKTSGLSVAELSSMSRTRRRWSSTSRTAPWTCGTQRSEYGSWTLWAPAWWLVWRPESRSRWRSSAATATWPGMRPGELVGRGERHVGPEQRLDRHRRDDARRPTQPIRVGQEQRPDRAHHLGPVEERQPFLRPRAPAARGRPRASASSAGHPLAVELDLAAADERQREVGERREVARTRRRSPAPGTTGWMPGAQERRAAGRRAAAGSRCGRGPACSPAAGASPGRPRAGTAARRRPRGSSGGSPGAGRCGRVDRRRGQVAEPGRDAVDHGAVGDQRLDDVARLLHPRRGRGRRARAVAPWRATASTSAIVRSAPVRTIGPAMPARSPRRADPGRSAVRRVGHAPRIVGRSRSRAAPASAMLPGPCCPSSTRSSSRSSTACTEPSATSASWSRWRSSRR